MPKNNIAQNHQDRSLITQGKTWVVKIGSALITQDGQGLAIQSIASWAAQMAELKRQGKQLVLVSSGAVAQGMLTLGHKQRPETLHELQAFSAVGQTRLVRAWESAFAQHSLKTAQVLLTHEDLASRPRYLNAGNTLRTLLELGVIPVINENDTVATDEIRFGDNDSLAALVTNLVEADVLAILTDQKGLFDADPRHQKNAQLIHFADANDKRLLDVAGEGGVLGRGGMVTKVQAGKKAARSGAQTLIASGEDKEILIKLAAGERLGTWLSSDKAPLDARKQWLASRLHAVGELVLDDGAVSALVEGNKSLLPVGILEVRGIFHRGDLVRCLDKEGKEVARGLVAYSSEETKKIKQHKANELTSLLGYSADSEVIHRDNLVLGD